ncbi:mobile mystery protein B [Paremcibacter congregatus]|uniref:mobile mystery protein B n=1 Tax=Paremcibacter congregatus TaxID=2043170 RepID=UPI0030EE1560|tara:strand:+ start:1304 stop:1891 length:588 start_codon:yes stop_codon:yes gene_type:complete
MTMDYPPGATPLDPDELTGLKFRHVTSRNELDHLEQANIQDGLKWLSRNRESEILTEAFVCKLHKQLFGQVWTWAGRYRTTGKNIGVDAAEIGTQLRLLLDDVKYWCAHETYRPIECAVRFHHKLVYIHAFPNGNGRHARIMADTLLIMVMGEPAIDWAGGHDLQDMGVRRSHYIAALKAADNYNLQPLLDFAGG